MSISNCLLLNRLNDTITILLHVLDKMISFDPFLGVTFKTNLDLIFFFFFNFTVTWIYLNAKFSCNLDLSKCKVHI